MAEMFGNNQRRIPVSKDNIRKALKAANDKLQRKNDKIGSSIKDAESKFTSIKSNIKSAEKELKDYTSRVDSRISECTAIEQQLSILQSDLSNISGSYAKELAIKESLKLSVLDLTGKEEILIQSVAILDKKRDNTQSINTDLQSAKNSYDQIKKDLAQIKTEQESALSATKKANITKDFAEETSIKAINKLEETKISINRQIKDMDLMLNEKSKHFTAETSRLDNLTAERLEEIEINTSLVNMKEKEYEAILTKVIAAEKKIEHADKKIEYALKRQEESITNIKNRFESWKLNQLDQVAKLKLRGKMENIENAELEEILGG